MKNNIKKLSLKFLWGHKKQTQALMTILSMCVAFSFFVLNYKEASRLNRIETLSNIYGHFNQAVFDVDIHQADKIMQHELVEHAGQVRVYKEIHHPTRLIKLGSMDQEALRMLNVHLQQGRMPLQDNEIALEETVLYNLGYPNQLGISIELDLKTYTLVGIVNDYNENLVLPALHGWLSYNDPVLYAQVYIQSSEGDLFSAGLKQQVVLNQIASLVSESYLNEMIITIYGIWFVVFMVVLSIFYLQVKQKVSQFLLLRSMGASQKQIRKIIYYQGIYLFKSSVLIGLSVGIIVFEIVCYLQFQTLYFNIGLTLLTLIYVLLCLMMGLVFPANQASHLSMGGHLESKYTLKTYKTVSMSIKNLNKRYNQVSPKYYYFQLLFLSCCLLCSFEAISYHHQVKLQQANRRMSLYDFSIQSDFMSMKPYPPLSDLAINDISNIAGISDIQTINYINDFNNNLFLNIVYISPTHQKGLDYFKRLLTPEEFELFIHKEEVIYLQYPSIKDKKGRSGINFSITQKDMEFMENVLDVDIFKEDVEQVKIENQLVDVVKTITNIDMIKDIYHVIGINDNVLSSHAIRVKEVAASRVDYVIETTGHDYNKVVETKLKQILQPEYGEYRLVNHYDSFQEGSKQVNKRLQNNAMFSVLGIGMVFVIIYTYGKGKSLEQKNTWKTFKVIGMSKKMLNKMEYHWMTQLYLKGFGIVVGYKTLYFLYHFYYGYKWGGQALLNIYLEWRRYPYLECILMSIVLYVVLIKLYKIARKSI